MYWWPSLRCTCPIICVDYRWTLTMKSRFNPKRWTQHPQAGNARECRGLHKLFIGKNPRLIQVRCRKAYQYISHKNAYGFFIGTPLRSITSSWPRNFLPSFHFLLPFRVFIHSFIPSICSFIHSFFWSDCLAFTNVSFIRLTCRRENIWRILWWVLQTRLRRHCRRPALSV